MFNSTILILMALMGMISNKDLRYQQPVAVYSQEETKFYYEEGGKHQTRVQFLAQLGMQRAVTDIQKIIPSIGTPDAYKRRNRWVAPMLDSEINKYLMPLVKGPSIQFEQEVHDALADAQCACSLHDEVNLLKDCKALIHHRNAFYPSYGKGSDKIKARKAREALKRNKK